MIEQLLNAILPGDSDLNMPSATELGLHSLNFWQSHQQNLHQLQLQLQQLAQQHYEIPLTSISEEQFLLILNKAKRRQIQLVTSIVNHALALYYTNKLVLQRTNAGSVPPFPSGNVIAESENWEMLEAVYHRGRIYREVTNE